MSTEHDLLGYRGKRAVVTGCASGVGEATARLLSDLGAEVHGVDINKPTVATTSFTETDLSEPGSVDAAIARLAEVGPIDKLFNCAGVPHTVGPLKCMGVNWIGTRQLTEGLVPLMVDGGAIVCISSDAGIGHLGRLDLVKELIAIEDPAAARAWCEAHPEDVVEGYVFSKECVSTWTMMRAVDLASERRIRLNATAPSPIDTPFMVVTIADLGREVADSISHDLVGRMSTPEEQAGPLILLNSDLARITSGAVLYTDQTYAGGVFSKHTTPAF